MEVQRPSRLPKTMKPAKTGQDLPDRDAMSLRSVANETCQRRRFTLAARLKFFQDDSAHNPRQGFNLAITPPHTHTQPPPTHVLAALPGTVSKQRAAFGRLRFASGAALNEAVARWHNRQRSGCGG